MEGVGENHEETADDGEVAEEEVEVEDEAVPEGLRDDDAEETHHSIFGALAGDDHDRADGHGDHVGGQEEVREAGGN